MYIVSPNFHTLSIADAPKTRCRIYFIDDTVDCWDDNDVITNGTLLVGAVGDTDSNARIDQNGITFTELYNKEYNLTIGGTVSCQIEMTLNNKDGALDGFTFGRCKVFVDVYDSANATWLTCPMGVYLIDLPVKRKVQFISCAGYDQMQILNGTADTWWNSLNWSGGLTITNILNSLVTQLGVHLSSATLSNIVNGSVSFTSAPFDSVERTYRDVLGWIAEATGTVAHFNRDGELSLHQFFIPQINNSNIVIDTDTVGNQCLSIDIAEYQAEQIDGLTIKLTNADQGVSVGSGTNVYTIMDNPFLYGASVAAIQNKLTPIYNRINGYGAYSPISVRLITDWSIEAGDIIYIVNDSTTYALPIFQQKMTWRGGYVISEMISSGDTVLPQVSSNERETYRYNKEMATKVGDSEIISKINQSPEAITIQASKVDLTGYVTFTNLSTPGQTVIDGGNLVTGTVTANKLDAADINASKTLTVGAMTDAAAATILNSNIQIGGRNLCTGTATAKTVTTAANQNYFTPSVYPLSAYSATALSDASNTQVTVSFDYSITGVDTVFSLTVGFYGGQGYTEIVIAKADIPIGSSTGHAEATKDITNNMRQYAHESGVLFSGSGNANANAVLTVSNLKVEIGNKATTWTQAPEDVAADIATAQSTADSANSQEQLIYISKPSGTTTVSANTTWVTDTTGSQNTWTLKRPEYNSSYPVLFVATQRKAVDGTVTCTTPMIDLTTTVIDGGHITTGTIDASVVSVTNLNASNITSGSLSANYIQGGIMTVGGLNDTNGYIRILDSTGNYAGGLGASGLSISGKESSAQSHVASTAVFPEEISIRDQTTSKQMLNAGFDVADSTDEYASISLQGYDNGTQVSYAELNAYPYSGGADHGAYLLLRGPDGLVRLNSDGTYAGDLTLASGDLTVYGDATINNNVAINGVLDVTPSRCENTLPTTGMGAGWYRAIVYDAYDANSALGFSGEIVTIKIVYTSSVSCQHFIKLFMSYNKIVFLGEESSGTTNIVDKIRYVVDGSKGYVDIHYNSTTSLQVNVSFDVASRNYAKANWKASTLIPVETSPVSPASVVTEYSFFANTNDDTSLPAYGKTFYFHKRNGIVYIEAPDAMTPTTNGSNWVGTLPAGFRPSGVVRFDAAGSAGAYKVLYIDSSGGVTAICYTTANVSTSFGITGSYIAAS